MYRAKKSSVRPPDLRTRKKYPNIPPAATSDLNHHPLNVLSAVRLRRAPGGNILDDYVNKMQALARVANAIYLEIGLIDGKLKVDDVIQELLHTGNLTLASLGAIDETVLTGPMDGIRDLKEKLKPDSDVKDGVDRLKVLEEVRSKAISSKMADKEADYTQKLTNLKTVDVKDSVLNDLKEAAETAKERLEGITKLKSDTDQSRIANDKTVIPTISLGMKDLETAISKVNDVVQAIKEMKVASPLLVQPYDDELTVRKNFVMLTAAINQSESNVEANFNELQSMSTVFKNSDSLLRTVEDFIEIRDNSKRWHSTNTAGFVDGPKDLDKLAIDLSIVKDQFGKNETRNDLVMKGLIDVFEFMNDFKGELKVMDTQFRVLTHQSKASFVKTLHAQQEISKQIDVNLKALGAFIACDRNGPTDLPTQADLTTAFEHIKHLDDALNELTLIETIKNMTGVPTIKAALTIGPASTDADVKTAVTKLKAMNEVTETIAQLGSILLEHPKFKTFIGNRTEVANEVENTGLVAVKGYRGRLQNGNVLGFYDCLKNIQDNNFDVSQFAKAHQWLSTQDDSFKEAASAIGAFITAKQLIPKAQKLGAAMSKVKNDEKVKLLKKGMGKADKSLLELVSAVRGLVNIRELEAKKEELNELWNVDVSGIATAATAMASQLDPKEVEALKKFDGLKDKLIEMFNAIDTFKKSLTAKSGADAFKLAAKVPSWEEDVKEMKAAIEKLATVDSTFTKKTEIVKALDTLDKLDLKFTNYNIGNGETALGKVQGSLGEYAGGIENSGIFNNSPAPLGSKDDSLPVWAIALIAISVLLCLVAAIVAVIFFIKKKKEEKARMEEEEARKKEEAARKKEEEARKEEEKGRKEEAAGRKKEEEARKKEEEARKKEEAARKKEEEARKNENDARKLEDAARAQEDAERKKLEDAKLLAEANQLRAAAAAKLEKDKVVFKFLYNLWNKLITSFQKTSTCFSVTADDYLLGPSAQLLDKKNYPVFKAETRHDNVVRRTEHCVNVTGFPKKFIHANKIVINEKTWIMCQAPLDGTIQNTIPTIEKHYAMVCQNNVALMMQLCNFKEGNKDMADRYYHDKVGEKFEAGRYIVTTVKEVDVKSRFTYTEYSDKERKAHDEEHERKQEELKKQKKPLQEKPELPVKYICRTLEVHNQLDNTKRMVDIIRLNAWPDDRAPAEIEHGAELCRFADSYKGNVVVHCSAGVGRTGTLAAIRKGLEMFNQGYEEPSDPITAVRECRLGAVKNGMQGFYAVLGAGKALMMERGVPELEVYDRLVWAYGLVHDYTDEPPDNPKGKFIDKEERDIFQEKINTAVAEIAKKYAGGKPGAFVDEPKKAEKVAKKATQLPTVEQQPKLTEKTVEQPQATPTDKAPQPPAGTQAQDGADKPLEAKPTEGATPTEPSPSGTPNVTPIPPGASPAPDASPAPPAPSPDAPPK